MKKHPKHKSGKKLKGKRRSKKLNLSVPEGRKLAAAMSQIIGEGDILVY